MPTPLLRTYLPHLAAYLSILLFANATTSAQTPPRQLTVLEDTLIRVMTDGPLSSTQTREGAPVLFTLSQDVLVDGVLAIPRGAIMHGEVIRSKKSGILTGSPELSLKLVSLDLGGRTYPLYTYQFKVQGISKTGPTETKAVRGAEVGALAGGIGVSRYGRNSDSARVANMAAGAAVGAAVGTLVSAATPGPVLTIPAEAQVDFFLAAPITVPQASPQDAARLAKRVHAGGPNLYLRDEAPK